MIARAITARIV